MYSVQIEVSDGTLKRVEVGIEYDSTSTLQVYKGDSEVPLVLGTDYSIDGKAVVFPTAVPSGMSVVLRRVTPISVMQNRYDGGAAFSRDTLDENFLQILRLAQEFTEGAGLSDIFRNINLHGFRIKNMGDPVDARDATTKLYVDLADDALDARVDSLEAGLPVGNNSVPWRTVLSAPATTLAPPYSFRSAILFLNGVAQSYGSAYSVNNNVITLAASVPAGTEVFAILGQSLLGDMYVDRQQFDTFTNQLLSSSGANYIGYQAPGTGAVFRTLKAKLTGIDVDVEDYGAVGDGITDDTPAFQRAIGAVRAMGGGIVRYRKRHLIDQNLYVEDYVSLEGGIKNADELLDGVRDYDSKGSILIINPAVTVRIQSGASVSQGLAMRKGLNLPFTSAADAAAGIAAFAGTAFTGQGAGVSLHNMLVLGFQWLYRSANLERPHIHKVYGDCTNGIEIAACYDIADITENEMWPYTTTHQSWTTGALNKRSGVAFRYANVGDWNRFTRCFSYGYEGGFQVDSCDNVVLVNCGTDHVGADTNTTSIGFNFTGTSKNPVMIGCQGAAQYRGVVMNSTAGNGNVLQMIGCQFWDNDDLALKVINGYVLASACVFRGGPVAADVDNTSLGAHFANCRFDGQTVRPVGGSGLTKVTAVGNTYVNTVDDTLGQRELVENQLLNVSRQVHTASTGGTNRIDRKAQGTAAAPAALADGSVISAWSVSGYKGDAFSNIAQLRGQVQGTVSNSTFGGGWIISTAANSGTSMVDRWGFMQNGNLQPIADNAVQLGASGARVSSIWAANGTIQTSDARTKLDVEDSALGLDFINSLRPVSYRWKEGRREIVRQVWLDADTGEEVEEGADNAIQGEVITRAVEGERTHWGLIAQEVKQAADAAGVDFAGWVLSDKDDADSQQALRYDQFISPLIKAVQELAAQVQELKQKQ